MRPTSVPPTRLMFAATFLPEDFPTRLERFKEATGFTWDGLAGCLGVDPRQLQRWRKDTKPDGDGLCALRGGVLTPHRPASPRGHRLQGVGGEQHTGLPDHLRLSQG